MRYILIFWAAPLGFFWGWYFLSLNDINFGTAFFSERLHRLVFDIYGGILGLEPHIIPAMIAKACILDTALIFSILAFRKRHAIKAWWISRGAQPEAAPADNLVNLSNAP
jgi:Family of unknown function (DUF6105)